MHIDILLRRPLLRRVIEVITPTTKTVGRIRVQRLHGYCLIVHIGMVKLLRMGLLSQSLADLLKCAIALYLKPGISLGVLLQETTRRVQARDIIKDLTSDSHLEVLAQAQIIGFVISDHVAEVEVSLVLISSAPSARHNIIFIGRYFRGAQCVFGFAHHAHACASTSY